MNESQPPVPQPEKVIRILVVDLVKKLSEKPANYLPTVLRLSNVGAHIVLPESCYAFLVGLFSQAVDEDTIDKKTADFLQQLEPTTQLERIVKKQNQPKPNPGTTDVERAFFDPSSAAVVPEQLRQLKQEYLAEVGAEGCSGCTRSAVIQKYMKKIKSLGM